MPAEGGVRSPLHPVNLARPTRVFRTDPLAAVASPIVRAGRRTTCWTGFAAPSVVMAAKAALLGVVLGLSGCRNPATATPKFLGDTRDLDAERVDPAFRDDWVELQRAREADPGAAAVVEIADRLLAREPPIPVRLSALRAKAEHAYLQGDDLGAARVADEGLALVKVDPARPPVVILDLARIRARALARGGDPTVALAALASPLLSPSERLPEEEREGLRAVALDRNADHPAAVAAYARWRATLDDAEPTAAWVEHRLAVLADALDGDGWTRALQGLPPSPARVCLLARAGIAPVPAGSKQVPEDQPAWVARCGGAQAGAVGLLLPRSGKLAALSDVQLAAAVTAVEVLGSGGAPLLFRDCGSSKAQARAAAEALVAEGVHVLVGPVGASNVEAVVDAVGRRATVVVPGEARGAAVGVAPSLERRVQRLIDHAKAQGKSRLVVLAPENAYGKRVIAAANKSAGALAKGTVVRQYPGSTTSFKPVLDGVMTALSPSAAVLVADHLPRTELVVRQLMRSGKMPARGASAGLMVMTTAEGANPEVVADAPEVFEGVWAAPVAAAVGPEAEAFAAAFLARQGTPPDDQALLVFHALRRALVGSPDRDPGPAPLVRFEEGRVVVQAPGA